MSNPARQNDFNFSHYVVRMPVAREMEAVMSQHSVRDPRKNYRRTDNFGLLEGHVILTSGSQRIPIHAVSGANPGQLLPLRFCGVLRRSNHSDLVNTQRMRPLEYLNHCRDVDKVEQEGDLPYLSTGDDIYATLPYDVENESDPRVILHKGTKYDSRSLYSLCKHLTLKYDDVVVVEKPPRPTIQINMEQFFENIAVVDQDVTGEWQDYAKWDDVRRGDAIELCKDKEFFLSEEFYKVLTANRNPCNNLTFMAESYDEPAKLQYPNKPDTTFEVFSTTSPEKYDIEMAKLLNSAVCSVLNAQDDTLRRLLMELSPRQPALPMAYLLLLYRYNSHVYVGTADSAAHHGEKFLLHVRKNRA